MSSVQAWSAHGLHEIYACPTARPMPAELLRDLLRQSLQELPWNRSTSRLRDSLNRLIVSVLRESWVVGCFEMAASGGSSQDMAV